MDKTHVKLISEDPQETFSLGKVLGENLHAGDVVALVGELGAGKTCLTQGIARGLGVPECYQITSPTFTLINEYPGRFVLYHLDMYRLSGVGDLEELGYEEYFGGDGVLVIEWAEKISAILPDETLFVSLTYLDENKREIDIYGGVNRIALILAALKEGGF
ncbi:MAG: tRNA (adenosine(37)-N6)-threonylcarbamoyltransferase complex ATPase subunit type 1 TsaE [Syntrophales bacterium]|nr:tRNA (adenosine(37)-N6)-threonylcarbamoyltransferase complex ATPase subunit type 1 TsaE [Syntrophales bacterium]